DLRKYPPEKTVLITTGSQGETMASLSRMAANIHKKVQISPDDVIILSSNPIPGNEKAVAKIINELSAIGAKVIFQDTHVSGHACREEIKLMYTLVKPRYAVPVHGEYRHLMAHRDLLRTLGYPRENIIVLSSGQVLEFSEEKAEVTGSVPVGGILVDGLGVGDVGSSVLKDRQSLSVSGIITVVLVQDSATGEIVAGPEVHTRGFVYERDSEDFLAEIREAAWYAAEHQISRNRRDSAAVKYAVRSTLSDLFWKRMKRNPVILPIIMEV
ncbi:MAG: ribonuclease J, partial [Lachnospiraceae bacterium]|nr:ribonuclease J [Lachnospiraceae bacterium]